MFKDIKEAGKYIRKREKINASLLAVIIYTNDSWLSSKHGERNMQVEFYKRTRSK